MSKESRSLRQRLDSLPTWALVVLCAIYCISPIDLVPFIPIDDIFVFGWTVGTIFKRLTTPCKGPPTAAHDVKTVESATPAGIHSSCTSL